MFEFMIISVSLFAMAFTLIGMAGAGWITWRVIRMLYLTIRARPTL